MTEIRVRALAVAALVAIVLRIIFHDTVGTPGHFSCRTYRYLFGDHQVRTNAVTFFEPNVA